MAGGRADQRTARPSGDLRATIGVKMGIRAREYFNIGVDDILVTTYAGHKPPVSCMNDGLQVGNGGLRRTWADYRCGNRHAAARSAFHLQGQDDTVGPETPVCRPYPQGCEAGDRTIRRLDRTLLAVRESAGAAVLARFRPALKFLRHVCRGLVRAESD